MLNLNLQNLIYSSPKRIDLIDYIPVSNNNIKILIYRNHSFELIENTIKPFLDFAGYSVEFVYSDYDDSLSFINLDFSTDMMILWLDLERYTSSKVNEFLADRISYLNTIYKKPVLFAFIGNYDLDKRYTFFDFANIQNNLGESFFDIKKEKFTGTRLSAKALLKISFDLGLNYIPSILHAPVKAIVTDLDNTLYKGILGEDGIEGIVVDENYKKLQKELRVLKSRGIFLAISSKNDDFDVRNLLDSNKIDLKVADFDIIKANWNNKSKSIIEIAKQLNIGLDSILFIDDNPGELLEVESAIPECKKLLADVNPEQTLYSLTNYPGLKRFSFQYEDLIRSKDADANLIREQMKQNLSEFEYLKSLEMKLTFSIDKKESFQRICELANKTNQFIFNYRRYTLQEIIDIANSDSSMIVSMELQDTLSDSGLVGVCVGKKENDCLIIDECFISCRALGRGIENIMINIMIDILCKKLGCCNVKILFKSGERNNPAKLFLENNLKLYINNICKWNKMLDTDLVEIKIIE